MAAKLNTSAQDSNWGTAYGELQSLLLEGPDVTSFLQQAVELASTITEPPVVCGVTTRRDRQVVTVATSGELAVRADEIQYGRGQGPCLEALHTGELIHVPDLAADDRWPEYRSHAVSQGVASSLSVPLIVRGATLGALNLYSPVQHRFTDVEIQHAAAFSRHTATGLAIVLRHADQVKLEDQLRDALATRGVIDQALGILMAQRGCNATEAFSILREESQHRNTKVHEVAGDLIETVTGQRPQPPRPFLLRG